MSNSRRLRKFRGLSAPDRRYLLRVALLVAAMRLALSLLPFQTIVRHFTDSEPSTAEGDTARIERAVWAVRAASTHVVPRATCLMQALALLVLLRRQGQAARLRLGVARDEATGQLAAHAWVEDESRVLIGEGGRERYTPLPALTGAGT